MKLIEKIYSENKDIDPKNIAFLTDRILVAEEKKQIFGTQFYTNGRGVFVPRPIQNKKKMILLRKKYGLPSFDEYLKLTPVYRKEKN